jgi:hypothetical protein
LGKRPHRRAIYWQTGHRAGKKSMVKAIATHPTLRIWVPYDS